MEWVGEEKLRSVSFSCCIFQNFILSRDQDHKCTATNVQNTERIRKINLIYTDEHYQWRQAYVVVFTVKKKKIILWVGVSTASSRKGGRREQLWLVTLPEWIQARFLLEQKTRHFRSSLGALAKRDTTRRKAAFSPPRLFSGLLKE